MLLLASASFAQGLPFACPDIATPADAAVYRSADDAEAVVEAVRGLARPWEDYPCDWVGATTGDGLHTLTEERACDDGTVQITSYTSWWTLSDTWETESHLVVSVPSGETWTTIRVTSRAQGWWDYDGGNTSRTERVAWTGAIEGLPDDGWVEIDTASRSRKGGDAWEERSVETPTCAWTWGLEHDWLDAVEVVGAAGRLVRVWSGVDAACDQEGAHATLDGTLVGAVDRGTWARDPADADGDGWPAGAADCDDADPTRSTCTDEVPNDELDQDCDGADLVDADVDDDGHDSFAFGGDDCDDADADVHPGADDRPDDALDTDCDGADDVDADGDRYTADGDAHAADCDDTDPAVNAGEPEIPYDGVDQDCVGGDARDVDADGVEAAAVGGADCDDDLDTVWPGAAEVACDGIDQDCDGVDPCAWDEVTAPATTRGCGSAALVLLLAPLGLRRRVRTA